MSIRTMWRSLIDEIEAGANLKTAELRHGLTVMEAAAFDEKRTELAMVVGSVNVNTYMAGAVEMAKLGIWPDELEQMARLWSRAKILGLDNHDTFMRLLHAEAEREGPHPPDKGFDQFIAWVRGEDPKEEL